MFNREHEEYIRTEKEFVNDSEEDISVQASNEEIIKPDASQSNLILCNLDIYGVFSSELENDEELLWSGKRNERRCKAEINEILTRLVIGFIWTSFSLFTFILSFVHSETNKRYWFPRILGFVFTVIGILIFAYALPPKNEYYAITTKRIIVYNKKKKKPYESYKLSELSEPLLILNKSGDGVGIIKVSQKTPVKYRDEEISMTRYERFFYSIDNAAAVYDILNNQLSEFEM